MEFAVDHNGVQTKVPYIFDKYGNLFFLFNGSTYSVEVNGKNQPFLDKCDIKLEDLENSKVNFNKIQLYEDGHKLQKRLMDEVGDEEDYDSDGEYIGDIDYLPEQDIIMDGDPNDSDQDYAIIDEDIINQYGADNLPFKFLCRDPTNPHNFTVKKGYDVCALYDIYVYIDEKLVLLSCSQTNSNTYIMHIVDNKDIHFRSVDSAGDDYKLCVKNDELGLQLV